MTASRSCRRMPAHVYLRCRNGVFTSTKPTTTGTRRRPLNIQRTALSGIMLAASLPAFAQGPAGIWSTNVETPGVGPVPTTVELIVEGERLTGTVSNNVMFMPLQVQDGTVKGNAVAFKLPLSATTLHCKG